MGRSENQQGADRNISNASKLIHLETIPNSTYMICKRVVLPHKFGGALPHNFGVRAALGRVVGLETAPSKFPSVKVQARAPADLAHGWIGGGL